MHLQFLLNIFFCFKCQREDFVNGSFCESTDRFYSMNTTKDWRHEQRTNNEVITTIHWMIRRTNQLVLLWMKYSSDSSMHRFEQFLYFSPSRTTGIITINHDFICGVHMICDLQLLENKQIVWVDSGTLSPRNTNRWPGISLDSVKERQSPKSNFWMRQFFYWARWLRLDCDGYSSEETTLDEPESWIQRWSDDQLKQDRKTSCFFFGLLSPLLIDGSEHRSCLELDCYFPIDLPMMRLLLTTGYPCQWIQERERERRCLALTEFQQSGHFRRLWIFHCELVTLSFHTYWKAWCNFARIQDIPSFYVTNPDDSRANPDFDQDRPTKQWWCTEVRDEK